MEEKIERVRRRLTRAIWSKAARIEGAQLIADVLIAAAEGGWEQWAAKMEAQGQSIDDVMDEVIWKIQGGDRTSTSISTSST
jgi:hypothetical protein